MLNMAQSINVVILKDLSIHLTDDVNYIEGRR